MSITPSGPERLDKVQMNRVRRMAHRQDLSVHKNIGRCYWGQGYNRFIVYPLAGGEAVFGVNDTSVFTATLDEVEAWLIARLTPAPSPSKAIENRVRRAAERVGLKLRKARARDPRSSAFATYQVVDGDGVARPETPVSLDGIEALIKQPTPSPE